jgi:diguanylate cyclase (GGDEF)-like protein/PAS domain S-box-containing protein
MRTQTVKSPLVSAAKLRRKAEERLRSTVTDSHCSGDATRRIVHELEVHQIELEMQNEGLHQAQDEVETARDKYTALYDLAPSGYFVFDGCGQIQEVNLAGALLLGKERSVLAAKSFSPFLADAAQRKAFALHLQSVLTGQGVHRCDIRLAGKGGAPSYGQVQSVKLDAADGADAHILSSIVDVTAATLLAQERNRLAMIVESSNDAIFSINLDHAITSWNRGAEGIFGYTAEEVVGQQVFILIPAALHGEREEILRAIRSGEQLQHYETTRLRKDGAEIFMSITTSAVLDADGKLTGNSVIARDVTERARMEEVIRHQANHDTLTNLPNRQLFMELLALELADARRRRKKLALLFLDLNGFKQVNDTLGHDCGDLLLQEVARRLKSCMRASDTVARLGGDEFTVLMPEPRDSDAVGKLLGKIMAVFKAPFLLGEAKVEISASLGVSIFPDDAKSGEELMKKADIAMYEAKSSGRSRYQFYDAEINARTVQREGLEEGLRLALDAGEMELLFHPLVSSESRLIVGAEALLRWRHPVQGLLKPEAFLEVAEDSGAIVAIGEWALREACIQARIWNEGGYPLSVCVNLSNRQFHQPNFIERTAAILAETGLVPHLLEFDISEQTIASDSDYSQRSMQALADMGITLTIDNFGCGTSSLQTMKTMPSQKVKLDRTLIGNMLTQPDDLSVIKAIIDLSHNLRMTVVASGVETEQQLALIRHNGCDQAQGYLISKPLPADRFLKLLAKKPLKTSRQVPPPGPLQAAARKPRGQ